MKKFLIPVCCFVLTSCNTQFNQKYQISIEDNLYSLKVNSFVNEGQQYVEATIENDSSSKYLIYLKDNNNKIIGCKETTGDIPVIFTGIKSNCSISAAKIFNSSFKETGVKPYLINDIYPDYYNNNNSDAVEKSITSLKENDNYTFDHPLLMKNPYGTDEFSTYVYFKDDEDVTVSYDIVTENHKVFHREVLDDFKGSIKKCNEHEFIARGSLAGESNNVVINLYKNSKIIQKRFITNILPSIEEIDDKYKNKHIQLTRYSDKKLSDGLYEFSVAGTHSMGGKNRRVHVALMDNDADIRIFIPLNGYFFNNILLTSYDNQKCMAVCIDYHQIAFINYLGKVVKVISIDKKSHPEIDNSFFKKHEDESITEECCSFIMHHDFCFDNEGNLLILAGKATEKEMKKEGDNFPPYYGKYIIKYNINPTDVSKKDKIEVLVDFNRTMFKNYHEFLKSEQGVSMLYDWFHPNTIQCLEDGDIIVSSRETSSVVKLKLGDPLPSEDYSGTLVNETKIDWVITQNKNLLEKEADSETTFLKKTGDACLPNMGQHTSYVTKENIFPERKLTDSQYYLTIFSNNTTTNHSKNEWNYDSGVDKSSINNQSKGRVYLVDEATSTYEKVLEVGIDPYSEYQSSFIYFKGYWVAGSSTSLSAVEYDLYGNKVSTIQFLDNEGQIIKKLGYRVLKTDII